MKSGKSLLRLAWTLLAIAALVLVFTTLEESDEPFPEVRPDARYERLFPTYVELCAVSQIRAQFERRGTSFGHAVMYLGGACRSDDAPYPSLEVCGDERDRNPAEAGIGISVNRLLRNVNWIATPGSRLFFHGGLEPGERLDQARALETLSMVKARGVFSGVEVHGSYLPPDDDKAALVYLAAAEFLGTDFALNFGRSIFCARLPMPENVFQDVLDFLNAINREYAEGEADYRWSGYNDNCSHLLHNALAAAGVWREKSVRSFRLGQLMNLSVPANEYADLALRITLLPLHDVDAIHRDPVLRPALLERGWLPGGHGAIVTHIPVHQHNDLYDAQMRVFMLRNPLRRLKSHRIGDLYRDVRNIDLEANLEHYRGVYTAILEEAGVRSLDRATAAMRSPRAEVHDAYLQYIGAQLEDVEAKLTLLRSMPGPTR